MLRCRSSSAPTVRTQEDVNISVMACVHARDTIGCAGNAELPDGVKLATTTGCGFPDVERRARKILAQVDPKLTGVQQHYLLSTGVKAPRLPLALHEVLWDHAHAVLIYWSSTC